jgi:hypothetical protein
MHQRLANEFLLRLARRALQVIAPCLREEEWNDAFQEFVAAFKTELDWFQCEAKRMEARLAGSTRKRRDTNGKPTSKTDHGGADGEPTREATGQSP